MTKTAVATMPPKPEPTVKLYQMTWTETKATGTHQTVTQHTKYFLENPHVERGHLMRVPAWGKDPIIANIKVTYIEIDPSMYMWSHWGT